MMRLGCKVKELCMYCAIYSALVLYINMHFSQIIFHGGLSLRIHQVSDSLKKHKGTACRIRFLPFSHSTWLATPLSPYSPKSLGEEKVEWNSYVGGVFQQMCESWVTFYLKASGIKLWRDFEVGDPLSTPDTHIHTNNRTLICTHTQLKYMTWWHVQSFGSRAPDRILKWLILASPNPNDHMYYFFFNYSVAEKRPISHLLLSFYPALPHNLCGSIYTVYPPSFSTVCLVH